MSIEIIPNAESKIIFSEECRHCGISADSHDLDTQDSEPDAYDYCEGFAGSRTAHIEMDLLDPLVRAVAEVAAERPDYIYPKAASPKGCAYVAVLDGGDICRCVVGEALHRLGVSDDTLNRLDSTLDGDSGISSLLEMVSSSDPRVRALSLAQAEQDGGTAWGEIPAMIEKTLTASQQ